VSERDGAKAVVVVRIPSILRELSDGHGAVAVDVEEAATVGDVLDRLAIRYPSLERRIRDELGAIRQHVNVFVGDINVRDADLAATPAPPGTEVFVLPAISGGASSGS
jgi:molybdopterin converting factor small subunit